MTKSALRELKEQQETLGRKSWPSVVSFLSLLSIYALFILKPLCFFYWQVTHNVSMDDAADAVFRQLLMDGCSVTIALLLGGLTYIALSASR
jgi:hypothetical protein